MWCVYARVRGWFFLNYCFSKGQVISNYHPEPALQNVSELLPLGEGGGWWAFNTWSRYLDLIEPPRLPAPTAVTVRGRPRDHPRPRPRHRHRHRHRHRSTHRPRRPSSGCPRRLRVQAPLKPSPVVVSHYNPPASDGLDLGPSEAFAAESFSSSSPLLLPSPLSSI